MKPRIMIAFVLLIAFIIPSFVHADDAVSVEIGGKVFTDDLLIENGRIIMSAGLLAKELGADVTLDNHGASFDFEHIRIELMSESNLGYSYVMNSSEIKPRETLLDTTVRTIGKELYVPVRFVAEAAGFAVSWDDKTKTAKITASNRPVEFTKVSADTLDDKALAWYEESKLTSGFYSYEDDEKTYILASLGENPTGGYSVEITAITAFSNGGYYIIATKNIPKPGSAVTMVITYPTDLVVIDGKNQPDRIFGTFFDDEEVVQINADDILSVELFDITGNKIKEIDDFYQIAGYYNTAKITHDPYILMLAGNMMKITLKNGSLNFTSYGSPKNVVASGIIDGENYSFHLISPNIAELLLGK
jgi:hypothetical protein